MSFLCEKIFILGGSVMKTIDDYGFTPEQKDYIKRLIEKRKDRSHQAFFNRYGVKNLEELDDLVLDANMVIRFFKENNGEYFSRLVDVVMHSPKFRQITNTKEIERVFEELTLIYRSDSSRMIYTTYKIAKQLKKEMEFYILNGPLGSLFIFYLLGVLKINPMDADVRHETLLGTYYETKKVDNISFLVRPDCVDRCKEIAMTHFSDLKPYYSYLGFSKDNVVDVDTIYFANDDGTLDDRFEKVEGYDLDVYKNKNTFLPESLSVSVCPCDLLEDVRNVALANPFVRYEDGLPVVINTIKTFNDYSVLGINEHNFPQLKKDPDYFDFNDIVSIISRSHSSSSDEDTVDIAPFYDRDSVFNFLKREIKLKHDICYMVMEKVRKGRYKKDEMDELFKPFYADIFEKITYLAPRSKSVQFAYYYLVLAADL